VDWSSDWFEADPQLTAYVIRAMFVDMARRGWEDPQGVRQSEYDAFDLNVRPHLETVLDIVIHGPPTRLLPALDTLLLALRDAYHTPPLMVGP